jgi:actin related protein 2/3 complex subunit 1A/1B
LGKLDGGKKATSKMESTAMDRFKQMVSRAQLEASDITLDSVHQNAINCIRVYERSEKEVTKITTSGLDGRLVVWNIRDLTTQLSNLRI